MPSIPLKSEFTAAVTPPLNHLDLLILTVSGEQQAKDNEIPHHAVFRELKKLAKLEIARVKRYFAHCNMPCRPDREHRYSSTISLTSALYGASGQRHDSAALPSRKRHGTHCVGGWVGLRPGLDGCGKSSPPSEFELRTF